MTCTGQIMNSQQTSHIPHLRASQGTCALRFMDKMCRVISGFDLYTNVTLCFVPHHRCFVFQIACVVVCLITKICSTILMFCRICILHHMQSYLITEGRSYLCCLSSCSGIQGFSTSPQTWLTSHKPQGTCRSFAAHHQNSILRCTFHTLQGETNQVYSEMHF